MILYKEQYWEKLSDYFYNHIHWTSGVDKYASINEWLLRDYNAETSYLTDQIRFKNERDATLFMLRWSE